MQTGTGNHPGLSQALSDDAFRTQVREWLHDNLPPDRVARSRTAVHPGREDMLGVSAVLSRRGWSVPDWPAAHGGTGWSPRQCQIFDEERLLAGGSTNNIQGVSLAGPVICAFGTAAQQARYLPGIREGREFWALGFSEPSAGSDLASVQTLAVRKVDHYVVDGQKIRIAQAMMADLLLCMVRTDPSAKPQQGLSLLLVPMNLPGIRVRPIQSIDEGDSLCEVCFDSVCVPLDSLLGEEGQGWEYARFLLAREQLRTAEVPRNKLSLVRLKDIAARQQYEGAPWSDDAVFNDQVAQIEIDLLALEAGVARATETADDRALTLPALKVVGSELLQRQLGLQVEALGAQAAVLDPTAVGGGSHTEGVVAEFLRRRAATIHGGSTEIQKNIIAGLLFEGAGEVPSRDTGDQALLRASARRYALNEFRASGGAADAIPLTRDAACEAWQGLAAQGYAGLGLKPAAGGAGGNAADLATVCEAFGAALLPLPFTALAVEPGRLIGAVPISASRRHALATRLISGDARFAVAQADPGAPRLRARSEPGGWRLTGHRCTSAGAGLASALFICAELDNGTAALFLLEAASLGSRLRATRAVDGQDLAVLDLDQLTIPASAQLGLAGAPMAAAIATARDHALVMACADAVGAMGEALRITRDYLLTRQPFGSALADSQALRHRLAEMHAERTIARAMVARAAAALDGDPGQAPRMAAACKARVGRAALFVANQSVQLHGGVGMTDASVIGRYYKRLFTFEALRGNASHHTRRFAWASPSGALPA